MAEATKIEIYQSFCDEAALLTASIQGLEASPALDTLDMLSAARTRLSLVQAALPNLCAEADREAAAERMAALLALHGPRWSQAATAKSSALGNIVTLLGQLRSEVADYSAAHGSQMSVLTSLPLYTAPFRASYSPAVASLQTIIETTLKGDGSWLAKVTTFDAIGISPSLPTE